MPRTLTVWLPPEDIEALKEKADRMTPKTSVSFLVRCAVPLILNFKDGEDWSRPYEALREHQAEQRRINFETGARIKAATGQSLTEKEKEYVERASAAQQHTIDTHKQIEELKASGEIPANLPSWVGYDQVLEWHGKMKAGEITRENFDKIVAALSGPIPDVRDAVDQVEGDKES